jgi:hypothetical protein
MRESDAKNRKEEKANKTISDQITAKDSFCTYESFNLCKVLGFSYNSIYKPLNLNCTSFPKAEVESKEYFAYNFSFSNKNFKFRVAKTTPTKLGQFVTLWKRSNKGPIEPFDIKDSFDFYIICVEHGDCQGQFVFPKEILAERGIISKNCKGGKRAMRVYPPWVKTESSQATITKNWQNEYFVDLSDLDNVDLDLVKKLYSF